MSKLFKAVYFLLATTFFLVGCSDEKSQEVATYDEAYNVEQRADYRELHSYLYEEYENNLDEMKQDPLFPEYVRLNGVYGVGKERERDNFKATVYLNNQTIQYGNHVIEYDETEDNVVLVENPTELMDETLVRMVGLAKSQEMEDREHNFRRLLTAGWLPIFTLVSGLLAWFKPSWVWYVEGGFRNKEAEPAGNALVFIKVQAVLAFILTIILVYFLFNQMA